MRTRGHLAAAMGVGTALVLAACGSSGGGEQPQALDKNADLSQQTLVVSIWADYSPDDLADRFEKKYGTKVKIVNHATNEEVVGKLTASADPGIDVAFMSGQYAQALNEQGLLEHFEKSFVPNEANLYPEATQLAYDKGNVYSMPYAWGTTGLCYRPDLTGYDPDSWNDLLDPKPELHKKTTMLATERWMALPALKALGLSANSTSDDDLAKVKETLLKTKPTLLAFDDTTFYNKLVSGEASLVEAWDGWCNYGIAENPEIKFVVPKEGSDLWVDTMTVLKSSKNKEAAETFVNYVLEADVHSWVAENILYKVPNKAAMEKVDPQLLKDYPNIAMSPSDLAKQETLVDVGEFAPKYSQLVTEVQAS